MPERSIYTETVRAGTPVSVGSVTLLPIERVVVRSYRGNTRVWFSLAKEPCAMPAAFVPSATTPRRSRSNSCAEKFQG